MRKLHNILLPLAIASISAAAQAQTYPAKTVRIATAGTGGGADLVSRLVAPEMSGMLGQTVVVENRGTTILPQSVAKAPADGYTLMMWGGAMWLGPLFQDLPYDPVRDFAPITAMIRAPSVLVVHPSVPARTVKELIAVAKARPGQLNFSVGPVGSSSRIGGELLRQLAGVDIVLVSYKQQAQESQDLLSGQIQITSLGAAAMTPLVQAGKVRPIGTTGPRRFVLLPDLPAVAETLPGFQSETLFAAFAPAKTPDAVIRQLNQVIVKALEKPEVKDALLKSGYETAGGTPEQLGDYVRSEIERVSKLAKAGTLKAE